MNALKRISCQEANAFLNEQHISIIDVRDEASFRSSHIKNALHIDNSLVNEFISQTNKTNTLLIYCYHGNSSQSAGQFFIEQGFENVYSIDGGFEQWQTEIPGDIDGTSADGNSAQS